MKVKYEVQPQNYSDLVGELIIAKVDNQDAGKTGYVSCNRGMYVYNGLNNALMKMILYSPPDIIVEQPMREKGIGMGLLDRLLDQLVARSFDNLIISLPDGEKKFYNKALGKLAKKGKIASVHYDFAFQLGPVLEVRI